ncbi:1,4-alpha-glucan branching protein GlgB [Temperatibacter marinus]|uniref:1,4-alpha-glucan branching enzyme GlgB n=1 Tax=Temperatibacter marinus TaxID=1456591 RepID=A0AA52EF97_9PROT|nr:1,4-alpha-glucan branching protein GlgB [Temperatibacter marinus]WND03660.1 1,4-alpha-glucan branching protein GlgB [Temperatibacter marinus]
MTLSLALDCAADSLQVDAIVKGHHENPYGFMGIHSLSGGGFIVRAFIPAAEKVELVQRGSKRRIVEMQCIHEDGFFLADLSYRKRQPSFLYKVWYKGNKKAYFVEDIYSVPLLLNSEILTQFTQGDLIDAYRYFGCHQETINGISGMRFSLWAPSAKRVAIVGEFNLWDGRKHLMRKRHEAGVFEAFIPGMSSGEIYKYEIQAADGGLLPLKADPYGRRGELRPSNASITYVAEEFTWEDTAWIKKRGALQNLDAAMSIYEIQMGSWNRDGEEFLNYRSLADRLIPYVKEMGFTHIQTMPISEYPFDGSWGYQPVGLFAPTARFGTPEDFKYFVNACHKAGIGVLFDWVPAHFPLDAHGLAKFDGTCLYEHEDPRQGYHPDWNTGIFNLCRNEVVNYLISSALFWLDEFHIDGLRVDAVSSMLYLNYSREEGEWIPNINGGHENLEAISLLQKMNIHAYGNFDGVITIAEESTAWPGLTTPVDLGGVGFGYKWNMGWMNDSLTYMKEDPLHRQHHHEKITFSLNYAFTENFILPLSHDEVVHGKGSILDRMPGDDWQKFANLRAYYAFMWAHPGKKLLFMGCEFGQSSEWNHDKELEWWLLDHAPHQQTKSLISALNKVYKSSPALHELDCAEEGFRWLQWERPEDSIIAFVRFDKSFHSPVLVICNFTPLERTDYRIGVPKAGQWSLLLNTDAVQYGGSAIEAKDHVMSETVAWDGESESLCLTVPPLSTTLYRFG